MTITQRSRKPASKPATSGPPLTYRGAGVDIDAGDRLITAIKPLAKSTARAGVVGALGGFGGLFDVQAAGFSDPILIAATDGVGTKLRLAIDVGSHETVGVDLVAMCVNDLITQGATPLFFLDYFATGTLSHDVACAVIAGIAAGCRDAGCALIGGETAEMPGMYQGGDYDLAGFAVGAVERGAVLTGEQAAAGDVLLGLASSGVHSNGYSLVRRVMERAGLALDAPAPFAPEERLGAALLTPTRIYVRACLAALQVGGVTGLAHITGGGLVENPPRAFGAHLTARIDCQSWPQPALFRWLAASGGIEAAEMARTFNCGIGMIAAVRPDQVDAVTEALQAAGETVYRIGALEPRAGDAGVILDGLAGQFRDAEL